MVLKPMAQYLHNPEDQQGTEIFYCGARVSWKQLGRNNPSVLLTSMKQQSRLKHSESAPATASCHLESAAPTVVCGRKPKMDKCLQEPQGHATALRTLKTAVWIPAPTTRLAERSLAPSKLQTDTKNLGSPLKSHSGPARQIPQAPWLEAECWWAKPRRGI